MSSGLLLLGLAFAAAFLLGYTVRRWPVLAIPLLAGALLAALLPESGSDEDNVGRVVLVLYGVLGSLLSVAGIVIGRGR
jgi:hypothetical protein